MPRKIKEVEEKRLLPQVTTGTNEKITDAIRKQEQLLHDLSDDSLFFVFSPDLAKNNGLGEYNLNEGPLYEYELVPDALIGENDRSSMFMFEKKSEFVKWLFSLGKFPITVYRTKRFVESFIGRQYGGGLSIFGEGEYKFRINIHAAEKNDVDILTSFFFQYMNIDESKRHLLKFVKEGILYKKSKSTKKLKLYWGEIQSNGENKTKLTITRNSSLIQKNKEKIYALENYTAEPIQPKSMLTTNRGENRISLEHGIQLMKKDKVKETFWFESREVRNQWLKVIEGKEYVTSSSSSSSD